MEKVFHTETGLGYKIEVPLFIRSFEILKDINKGAFSAVVKVKDHDTGNIYAAKIIPTVNIENKDQQHLIDKEIEILTTLTHKNIVNLYSTIQLFNSKNEEFIVLIEEFCPNGTLLEYVNSKETQMSIELRRISREITEAIKYLHDEGIAHCDIKPENILLTEDFTPKLCDFNLSKIIDHADQKDRRCTLAYSAPEIHMCHQIDFMKADIWSLGITLFAIYELKFPYKNISEAFNGRLFYSTKNCYLDSFTKKCLVFDPLKRATADELLKEPYLQLDAYVDDEEMIEGFKDEAVKINKTTPGKKVVHHFRKEKKKAKNDDDDQNKNDDIDLNVTLELGFDFSLQDDVDGGNNSNQYDEQKLNDYLELNYSNNMPEEERNLYEIERIESKICDNLWKVSYKKKNRKNKKKSKKAKQDRKSIDKDDIGDDDDFL